MVDDSEHERSKLATAGVQPVSVLPDRQEGFLHSVLGRTTVTQDLIRQTEGTVAELVV